VLALDRMPNRGSWSVTFFNRAEHETSSSSSGSCVVSHEPELLHPRAGKIHDPADLNIDAFRCELVA